MHLDQFTNIAAYNFPDADVRHLETCVACLYWAFSIDDVGDEGELYATPDIIKSDVNLYLQALYHKDFSSTDPYAMMLHEFRLSMLRQVSLPNTIPVYQSVFKRIQATTSPGSLGRFIRGLEEYFDSEVVQSRRRLQHDIPPVSEFIVLRRDTVAGPFLWALVEYSLDINLPHYVFDDPVVIEIDKAAKDIMAWQNDICSFNKEQAEDDYQNLVCSIMANRRVELQDAIGILTDMLESRVDEYINLKSRLPSFGTNIDSELMKFITGVENVIQGGIIWSYMSPRYYSSEELGGLELQSMIIQLKTTGTPSGSV
ncbi:hypothetical protein GALMADRAFT_141701 [Galerina marginata CBS 339.88]|uniref:Terpene synthase n=1 Tax=Galerina marginata (strain CBS 339.88) TaxID=685588 RepID=A0A067SSV3_GALM3|nr:hypothetical protein GALMADRAFT_141701 [Galerina marginata CBS 339.88]